MKIIRWILGRIILIIDFVTRPKKIIRSEEEQQKIDNTFSNHSIYLLKRVMAAGFGTKKGTNI